MTKFSEIYDTAIFKFQDYSFLNEIRDFKEAVLKRFLFSAITDFLHNCPVDLLDYDEDEEVFNQDLDLEVKEILACGIAYYWLNSKTNDARLLKNKLYSKDYVSYSPANLLKEIQSLRQSIKREYFGKLNKYSVRNGGIENLRV